MRAAPHSPHTAASLWLSSPTPERTWTKTGQRWLLSVSFDGGTFIFMEFWPDIDNKFFHQEN